MGSSTFFLIEQEGRELADISGRLAKRKELKTDEVLKILCFTQYVYLFCNVGVV